MYSISTLILTDYLTEVDLSYLYMVLSDLNTSNELGLNTKRVQKKTELLL